MKWVRKTVFLWLLMAFSLKLVAADFELANQAYMDETYEEAIAMYA
jgi:hypothetical protein